MIGASSSAEIARPVSEVYGFVSDCRNEPKWHSDSVEAAPLSDGPLAVGMKQRWVLKFMGKREMIMEVTRLEPERLEVFEARTDLMGMAPMITYSFERAGSGTRFMRSVVMDPKGMMKPMMRFMLPAKNPSFVKKLKEVLEG